MTTDAILAPVGRHAANSARDVAIVQKLLIARGFTALGEADGVCNDGTVRAIDAYQRGFLRRPDGVVDPGGKTWQHLAAIFSGIADQPSEDGGALTRPVPRPSPASINIGLTPVNNNFMLQRLGSPLVAGGYTSQCQVPTDPRLRRNLVTDSIGPFRVTGLVPAVLSLKSVMAEIARLQPAVHRGLGTAGMLCCRLVRGSTTSISNHSWGTAIDLTINGVLDTYGDDRVQAGLSLIAPIFNGAGWYWGAAFGKEDGMHFEGSRDLVELWVRQLR